MSTFILVIATFVIGMLIIFITLRIGVRMRLSIFWGIVCFSIGTGLSCGIVGFLATFSDDSSINWTILDRLTVAVEFFAWACFGTFILAPVARFIVNQQSRLKNNADRDRQ